MRGAVTAAERAKKTNRVIGQIKRNLPYRSESVMKRLYESYIESKLFYQSQSWHMDLPGVYKPLESTFDKFWRISDKGRPPEGVLPPFEHLMYRDLKQMHDHWHGKSVIKFE